MGITRAEALLLNDLTPKWSKPHCPHCKRKLEFKMENSEDGSMYIVMSRCRECISVFVADWGENEERNRYDRMYRAMERKGIDPESDEAYDFVTNYEDDTPF